MDPRLAAAMILLGSLVQVKGFGFALVSSRKRWMASLSSWREERSWPAKPALRAVAVGDYRFKLPALGRAQLDVRSLVHSKDLHRRAIQGIHKRIEPSVLVH